MASRPVPVLILDSDPVQRRLLSAHIHSRSDRRFAPRACESVSEAVASARGEDRRILIADLESIGGAEAIAGLAGAESKVIAVSARGSVHTAVAAMRAGAIDFVTKPVGASALLERLEKAMAEWPRGGETARPVPAIAPVAPPSPAGSDFEGFVGRSPQMLAVYGRIERMAASRAPIFITGESGTGKELCAEAVHARSARAGGPFVPINCSAIPKDLIESEIFGHVRGAFTGAHEARAGAAELADGGTLFLDEIGEMDVGLQAKLLRFIQTGVLRRVGDTQSRTIDVRFICATNRDPAAEVAAGRFREDLFYRLNVLPVHLPPLRERAFDILALARSFLARFAAEEGRRFAGFDAEAEALLLDHPWPGNVRELQNVLRRIVVLHDAPAVTGAMLAPQLAGSRSEGARVEAEPHPRASRASAREAVAPFWEQERRIIEDAIAAYDGNVARAAAALQISPSTIYRKRMAWLERKTA
ncbi:MAG: sigma-54-dependent Fis family transcriptional regulator [Bauldia sp.]|nr:sigma-54-dependent Fis family transcriptional regulator [Bauldia sp.]